MSKYLPVIITIVATVSSVLALPTVVHAHLTLYAILVAAAQLLHAVLPGIFGVGSGQ